MVAEPNHCPHARKPVAADHEEGAELDEADVGVAQRYLALHSLEDARGLENPSELEQAEKADDSHDLERRDILTSDNVAGSFERDDGEEIDCEPGHEVVVSDLFEVANKVIPTTGIRRVVCEKEVHQHVLDEDDVNNAIDDKEGVPRVRLKELFTLEALKKE